MVAKQVDIFMFMYMFYYMLCYNYYTLCSVLSNTKKDEFYSVKDYHTWDFFSTCNL